MFHRAIKKIKVAPFMAHGVELCKACCPAVRSATNLQKKIKIS